MEMASTVKDCDYTKSVPATSPEKVYIGRRTGRVIKIKARKDSHGFERVSDYFPDSEDEDEENKSYDTEPVKLKPNQYIGRRTGALIEINARKDSHGFDLIEDYFPDSTRDSDVITMSNKDLSNVSKLSASVNKSELQEKSQEDEAIEEKLESEEKSHHVSGENEDIVTPQEKELEISSNLTSTSQFSGPKKRSFLSVEIKDLIMEKITEEEEAVDIVGVSDEEEETNVQSGQNGNNNKKKVLNATKEDDSVFIDVNGAGRRKSGSCEEDASDFHDEPTDMEEVTNTSIPEVNPDNGEQVELGEAATPREDRPLTVDRSNLFESGQIVLIPRALKGKQQARDGLLFRLVKEGAEVMMDGKTILLPTGLTFFVPTGDCSSKNKETTERPSQGDCSSIIKKTTERPSQEPATKTTKRPWKKEEREAVMSFFKESIRHMIVPGKTECDACIRQAEGVLKDRKWSIVKY